MTEDNKTVELSLEQELRKVVDARIAARPAAPGPTIEEIERERKMDMAPGVGGVGAFGLSGSAQRIAHRADGRDNSQKAQDHINHIRSKSLFEVASAGRLEPAEVRAVTQSDVADKVRMLFEAVVQLNDRAVVIGSAMAGARPANTDSQPQAFANTVFEQQIQALDEIMRIVDNADFELRRVRAVLE